ncbi:MAG: hypothetical protein WEG36_14290 [Gemmatimonadota bacterium]
MHERHIRLGSLTARLLLPDERYGHDVAQIFGTSLQAPDWAPVAGIGAEIAFEERPGGRADSGPQVPMDGMVLMHDPLRPEIHTEALSLYLNLDIHPARIRLDVVRLDLPHFDLCVHLAVAFHKLLFLMDRVVLHGAAISVDDKVCLFLGDKGAGKSTIALKLARAGGTVLGEDHLILRRTGDGFVVSGCDERSRLTAKTEEFFFDDPLDIVPKDFAGTMKKEVPAGELFTSVPYTDGPVTHLFFPKVGNRLLPARLSRKELLLELMRATGKLQRFVDLADRTRFLELLAAFTPSVEGYRLELSEDLADLDDLVTFVRALPARGS